MLTLALAFAKPTSIFGRQLVRDLGPVERDGVRWGWILATRFYDLALATWVWKRIDGAARKDAGEFRQVARWLAMTREGEKGAPLRWRRV